MTITIDFNNDEVIIDDASCVFKTKTPREGNTYLIKQILEEVFNRLDYSILKSATSAFNIELVKLDEDTRKTIGEW